MVENDVIEKPEDATKSKTENVECLVLHLWSHFEMENLSINYFYTIETQTKSAEKNNAFVLKNTLHCFSY